MPLDRLHHAVGGAHDDFDACPIHQLAGKRLHAVQSPFAVTILDEQVPSWHVAPFAQALLECRGEVRRGRGGARHEYANPT